MASRAQTVNITDTIPKLKINPEVTKMIRFSGYMQPQQTHLIVSDSLKFNGIKTIKTLTVSDFMKMTQAEEEKYNKQQEAILMPLRMEQQRIIDNGTGKKWYQYNSKLGYQDPLKMPTELLNENIHQEDKLKEKELEINGADILKKYEPPQK